MEAENQRTQLKMGTHVEARDPRQLSSMIFPFETDFLTQPEAHQFSKTSWLWSPQDLPVSAIPTAYYA